MISCHAWDAPPPSGPFVALAPGEAAPLLPLDLPPGLRGPPRRAVALRQIEDRLGPGPWHIVPWGGAAWDHAIVASAADRDRWCAALAPLGQRCRALVPDYLALPAAAGHWVAARALDGARIRVRLGPWDGATGEAALLRPMLARLPRPEAAHAMDTGAAAVLPDVPAPETAAADLAAFAHGELEADLLRDPDGAAALGRALRPWAWVAGAAALGIGLWCAGAAVEAQRYRTAAISLQADVEALVRAELVPSGPLLDVRVQVARRLDAMRGGGGAEDPLAPLAEAGPALLRAGLTLDAVTLRDGRLSAEIRAPGFAALEAALSELAASGAPLRLEAPRTVADGVRATVVFP